MISQSDQEELDGRYERNQGCAMPVFTVLVAAFFWLIVRELGTLKKRVENLEKAAQTEQSANPLPGKP